MISKRAILQAGEAFMSVTGTASVETFEAIDPTTGNKVAYAQRYAVDHSAVGGPIQLTSSSLNVTQETALLLSTGAFEVTYNFTDVNAVPVRTGSQDGYLATELFSPTDKMLSNRVLAGVTDYGNFETPTVSISKLFGLAGGAYAFLADYVTDEPEDYEDRKTLTVVSEDGKATVSPVSDYHASTYPNPILLYSPEILRQNTDHTFTLSHTEYYVPVPDLPEVPEAPSGIRTIAQTYRDSGIIEQSRFVDFDGSSRNQVYTTNGVLVQSQVKSASGTNDSTFYDPTTGKKTGEYIRNADGSRTDVNLAVQGKPYAEQTASYDAHGKLLSMTRLYANGVTAFTQVNNPDGTGAVANYDTSGRETSSIASAADGSRVVVQDSYTGTSTTPSLVQETDYNAANQKVAINVTHADGSHIQAAYAAGETLTSSTGVADTLSSASGGGDTFVFKPAFGQDIITNFHAGSGANHDVADFTAFHMQLGTAQSQSDYLAQHLKQVGSAAVLTIAPNETVTLKNTLVASLSRDNVLV